MDEYHEKFRHLSDAYASCGGSIGYEEELVKKELNNVGLTMEGVNAASAMELKDAREYVKDQYLACLFLINADRARYSEVLKDLSNDFLTSQDNYPKTLTDAYNVLVNYKADRHQEPPYNRESIVFVAEGNNEDQDQVDKALVDGGNINPKKHNKLTCYHCGDRGHVRRNCPKNTFPKRSSTMTKEILQLTETMTPKIHRQRLLRSLRTTDPTAVATSSLQPQLSVQEEWMLITGPPIASSAQQS